MVAFIRVAMAALLVLSLPVPYVAAKPLSRILRDSGLSPEDFDIMLATARSLYDTPIPQPGKSVSWSNPESGAHGLVKLASVRKNCAYIQHFTYAPGAKAAREIRTPYCRAEDGRWLLSMQ